MRFGIGDGLAAGRLADEDIALVGERDDARRQPIAFRVGDDLRFFAFHHGDDRVGRAQVDADDFFASSHVFPLLEKVARGHSSAHGWFVSFVWFG